MALSTTIKVVLHGDDLQDYIQHLENQIAKAEHLQGWDEMKLASDTEQLEELKEKVSNREKDISRRKKNMKRWSEMIERLKEETGI